MKLHYLLIAAVALLPACRRQPAAPVPPPRPPLTVAAYYWPGQFWVDIASDQGWFREAGLDVKVIDTNADYFASIKDFAAGKIDIHQPTLFDVILLNAAGADLVAVAVTDQSDGADGIGARPGLETIAGLKGQRVGVAAGTYSEYLLSVVLVREGISQDEITRVDMPAEKCGEELAKGTVDAICTFEPMLSEGVEKVKGRKLWDTSDTPGVSPAVLAARQSLLRERADEVQKLLQVWQRSVEFLRQKPAEAHAIVARVNKKSPAEVGALAKVDRILDRPENLAAFSYAQGFDSLHGTARVMNDFLLKQKLAPQRIDSTEILDARFLKGLK